MSSVRKWTGKKPYVKSRSGFKKITKKKKTRKPYIQRMKKRPEYKYVDSRFGPFIFSGSAPGEVLNNIAVGSGFFNRIGRKIQMKSLQFNVRFSLTDVNNPNSDYLRILIVYDRQTNGAPPLLTDILGDTDNQGVTVQTFTSNKNMLYSDRFIIIRDYRFWASNSMLSIVPDDGYANTPFVNGCITNDFIKLDLPTDYRASTAVPVIGDIQMGSLSLIMTGVYVEGLSAWAGSFNVRLKYLDI